MDRWSAFVAKLVLTALSVFVQLAATGILLFVAVGAMTIILGDNDDGTFTPTTLRILQGGLLFAVFFAAWVAVLFVTIRGEIRMWRNRDTLSAPAERRQR